MYIGLSQFLLLLFFQPPLLLLRSRSSLAKDDEVVGKVAISILGEIMMQFQ